MTETTIPATEPSPPTRRGFFAWATFGLGLMATAAMAVPFVGYLIGPLRKRTPAWLSLGTVGSFPINETRLHTFDNPLKQPWDGMVAHTGVYVRNLGKGTGSTDNFLVFAINCTHLGCPVTWFPQSGLFMCPCHGGVYYETGEHASGPPPRGLYHCTWQVREGQLWIQAPHLPTLQDGLESKTT